VEVDEESVEEVDTEKLSTPKRRRRAKQEKSEEKQEEQKREVKKVTSTKEEKKAEPRSNRKRTLEADLPQDPKRIKSEKQPETEQKPPVVAENNSMAAIDIVIPSSAASALFLLEEPEDELRIHALKTLDVLADAFWPEISPFVVKIQALSEDPSFQGSQLAALVAARVLFHLGELDEALEYALIAGPLFDVTANSVFALTLRAKCIDEYISRQVKRAEAAAAGTSVDMDGAGPSSAPVAAMNGTVEYSLEGLQDVVERILDDCVVRGEVREALGVAIEARRLDRMRSCILEGCKTAKMRIAALNYCFDCVQTLVANRGYRIQVLKLIAELHGVEDKPDQVAIARCLSFIDDAEGVASCLKKLVKSSLDNPASNDQLIAYQIAFDIYDNDNATFTARIASLLPIPEGPLVEAPAADPVAAPAPAEKENEDDTGNQGDENTPLLQADASAAVSAAVPVSTEPPARQVTEEMKILARLRAILFGIVPSAFTLEFLCSENKADIYIMKSMKSSIDTRSSVYHSALVFANAVMHGGTTVDLFLRENLDWLARATSWAKFSATACLGVIHARHTSAAMTILSPYLSSNPGVLSSAYAEGGALFALGLISATGGRIQDAEELTLKALTGDSASVRSSQNIPAYLLTALRNASSNEIIQHGACLGLGLSVMSSWNGDTDENEIYEELKNVLFADSAVAGEAAGIGMGLVSLGSGSTRVLEEMVAYAKETEHEKIRRGLAMGIALICVGCEDDVDPIIEQLVKESDAMLRYSAMYSIGLAYAGTADNKAVRKLLHTAVSDVNDDVRRAAVINLGFVLLRHPRQVPKTIALLSESCHAHVRYGAALALGIACAGTGLASAVEILERLAGDTSDFVRQGALISLALVLMQHSEARSPKVAEVRKLFEKTYSDKHEEVMSKFGAIIANGLIDAGGRNVSMNLLSRSGHIRVSSLIGMAMFTQFWFWFPYIHFISLALKPTALVGITEDFRLPKADIKCQCRPSLFAYPRMGPPEKPKEEKKAALAVLSITGKAKVREAKKLAASGKPVGETAASMDVTSVKDKDIDTSVNAETDKLEAKLANVDLDGKSKEESSYILSNPCRVVHDQEKYMLWLPENRFQPAQAGLVNGFVVLKDTKPKDEGAQFKEMKTLPKPSAARTATAASSSASTTVPASATTATASSEPEPPAPVPLPDDD